MAEKLFYSMGEVAEMFDVNASLIRHWESQFSVIRPKRNKKGNRLFSPRDVENLKLIYHLVKERGMTLEGAKKALRQQPAEGGMERETAYNLSDLYIRKADLASSPEEINAIHSELITDFTERMAKLKNGSSYCYQVTKCMEYVYDHLHEKLMVSDIAEELGLSVQYLSKLFRTETGLTLNRYILKKKIDAACQMLKYSQYEAVDVGNFLAFSSHSHFIQKFREETGLTPKQYREKYYHSSSGMKAGVEIK